MKTTQPLAALVGCLCLVCSAQANLITAYTGPAIDIPDNGLTGITSTLQVSGALNQFSRLEVTLNLSGVNGQGFNGDLYAYLLHGTDLAVLLNRPGRTADNPDGYADAQGFQITIASSATRDLHNYQDYLGGAPAGALTGVWGADARNTSPFTVTDQDAQNAPLGALLNTDPNGAWRLFIADVSPVGLSRLNGWELRFFSVPDTGSWCLPLLAAAGLGAFNLFLRRKI